MQVTHLWASDPGDRNGALPPRFSVYFLVFTFAFIFELRRPIHMYGSPPNSEDHPSQSFISDFTSQQNYNILHPSHPRHEYSSYHMSTPSQFLPANPSSLQFQGNVSL